MRSNLLEGKKLEWALLCLFVIAYCVVSLFHEPWYDEALSWQIGKCASLMDILITLPPYEGHPPFWHLILAIPAKLGVPFEIGLKSIGLVISTISASVLLFKSKLPRLARATLPFTYFFFYQYGIVVRPYGLMLLALLLLGIHLSERNEHPWRIFFLLLFLCLTSAYGMLMAAGIACCMAFDIWREKGTKELLKGALKDQRVLSLLVLLLCALILVVEFFPAADGYSVSIEGDNPLWLCILCALVSLPLNCFFLSSTWFGIEQLCMRTMSISSVELISCCFIGGLFWLLVLCASSKKNVKYLVVPFAFYAFFAATVYFSTHHIGLVFLLFLFWAELISRDENKFEIGKALVHRIAKSDKDQKLLRKVFVVACGFCVVIPLYWFASASVLDIGSNYSYARETASYLKDHGLENNLILCQWNFEGSTFARSEGHDDYINTYIVDSAVTIDAYFSHNICMNLNKGADEYAYVLHKVPDYLESRSMVEEWATMGIPDVIIGQPNLKYVYGNMISYKDYALVARIESGFIWKNKSATGITRIYVRNDLLDQYGLKEID